MSTAFPVLTRSDHKLNLLLTVLRSESCSGYTDVFGNWNTGFYCPQSESKAAVYCCGTETYKYCCTAKDPNDEGGVEISEPNSYSIGGPLIVGIFGLVFIAFFVTLATCFFCPCCLFHKKRSSNVPSGLYRLQCGTSSTTSPLVNMNSNSSNLNSFTRLPPSDYGNGNGHPNPGQPSHNSNPENGSTANGPRGSNSFSSITLPPAAQPISHINYSGDFHSNQYDHFNPVTRPVQNPLPLPLPEIDRQHYRHGQVFNQNETPHYFQLQENGQSSFPRNANENEQIYTTFLPRCRTSYTNERSGSPCFTNSHLDFPNDLTAAATTRGGVVHVVYPSPYYNYPNSVATDSRMNVPASRNSPSSNAFSTAEPHQLPPPMYYGNGRLKQHVQMDPTTTNPRMGDKSDETPGRSGFSKSVHFADSNRSENENGMIAGNSVRDGNSVETTLRKTARRMSGGSVPSSSAPPTPMNRENTTPLGFKGIPTSSSVNNLQTNLNSSLGNEKPLTAYCEILTVL